MSARRKLKLEESEKKEPKKPPRIKLRAKTENQQRALEALRTKQIIFLIGEAGTGKTLLSTLFALDEFNQGNYEKMVITRPVMESGEQLGYLPGPQPLDANILTPNGWVKMGNLKVGDKVIAKDGNASTVLGIFPQGEKEVYKITTDDGCSTEACGDHPWVTRTNEEQKRNKKWSMKTTLEIKNSLIKERNNKNNIFNHALPRNDVVHFNKKDLPLSPYTLGALIGDGHLGNQISLYSMDKEIVERVQKEVDKWGIVLQRATGRIAYKLSGKYENLKPARPLVVKNVETNEEVYFERIGKAIMAYDGLCRNQIATACKTGKIVENKKFQFSEKTYTWTNPIKEIFHNLNLLHKTAYHKFIPDIYLYNSSIEERIALLQGLMDTDGSGRKRNGYSEASFTTVSPQLSKDIAYLVRSLGGRASISSRDRTKEKHKGDINGRKIKPNYRTYEVSVNVPNGINPFYLPRKAETYDKKQTQYQKISSIESVGKKKVQCILIDNPEHLYITDDFIVTHNTAIEKISPYLVPISEYIKENSPKDFYNSQVGLNNIKIVPFAYMRGVTWHKTVIIADELQNVTNKQLLMFLTRIGENSKIIITADPSQSDLKVKNNILDIALDLAAADESIETIVFGEGDIVRNEIIKKIVTVFKKYHVQ